MLREAHGRIEPVERVSIQPRGQSFSRTQFARGALRDGRYRAAPGRKSVPGAWRTPMGLLPPSLNLNPDSSPS